MMHSQKQATSRRLHVLIELLGNNYFLAGVKAALPVAKEKSLLRGLG